MEGKFKRCKFKKGDRVIVTAGRDRGAVGEVLGVLRADHAVVVQGVNMRKKRKKSKTSAGFVDDVLVECALHQSNVMHLDPRVSTMWTKVGNKVNDGKKVRYSRKSGELID